jgi:hypothetical protein
MISEEKLELLKFLAARNVCDGILYEPRIYCQKFDFSTAGVVSPLYSNEDIFRNGEQYPVRITHILAMICDGNAQAGAIDERLLQVYRLRIRSNDTYYMSGDTPLPLPIWHDKVTATSGPVSRSTTSWRFAHPFYMGGRDTLSVQVELEYPVDALTETSVEVWVQFHGFGALSRRPKELHGYVTFTPTSPPILTIPDTFFRNTGDEPLEMHSVDIYVAPPSGSAGSNAVGNIRRARLSIRQVGNGTNQRWTVSDALNTDTVPAGLMGLTTGRAMTHVLPIQTDQRGRGWIWEPNQGLSLEVTGPASGPTLSQLYIALAGEIIVK